jgi:SM-20-related protein
LLAAALTCYSFDGRRLVRKSVLPLRLELSPFLDAGTHAKTYAQDGIVQIHNVLSPASADTVADILEQQINWQLSLSEAGDPQHGRYDAARANAIGQNALNARIAAVLRRARSEFAFLYLTYPMIEAYLAGKDLGHPIHEVSEFLNGAEFLQLLRAVTGRHDILKAYALATHYRPGDFLTVHTDTSKDMAAEDRVCTYTLGFTRQWRVDWGGQLLFYDETGLITRGLPPAFNTLTLFTVPRAHAVAVVSPFTGAPRLSIVGWGRSDPGPKIAGDSTKLR